MNQFNILDYGAVADGTANCTEAIQRAIDHCGHNDMVIIPSGTFISGALFLKSDMTLCLNEGAKLIGSTDPRDYPIMTYRFEGYEQLCYASLINTDGAPHANISITGTGVIDASGQELLIKEEAEHAGARGRAVCIRNTTGLSISGVTIRQSPAWCLHLIYCQNVDINDVKVYTKYDEAGKRYAGIHNGDGIDIDSCKDVRISDCVIASQDDCIALKSGRNVLGRRAGIPTENVTIENCTFNSGFGVAVGSEMSGGVSDVYVSQCRFNNTFSIASIKAIRGRGSYVRNIHFENCTMNNSDTEVKTTRWFRGAIYVDSFYSYETFDAESAFAIDETTPTVEDIYFKDITLNTVEGYAIYLCGLPERHCSNISMENVRAEGPLGTFIKNVDNLQLENVAVKVST